MATFARTPKYLSKCERNNREGGRMSEDLKRRWSKFVLSVVDTIADVHLLPAFLLAKDETEKQASVEELGEYLDRAVGRASGEEEVGAVEKDMQDMASFAEQLRADTDMFHMLTRKKNSPPAERLKPTRLRI